MKIPFINFSDPKITKYASDFIKSASNKNAICENCSDVFVRQNQAHTALEEKGVFSKIGDIILKPFVERKAQKYAQELEKAKDGFGKYQYSSEIINSCLRSNPCSLRKLKNGFMADYFDIAIHFVKKGYDILAKPLQEDTTVYRLVAKDEQRGYFPNWKIGETVSDKGFISTSSEPDIPFLKLLRHGLEKNGCSEFTNIKILLPKGTPVIQDSGPMKEVLIKNNSSFKVVDFDEATNTYIWEFLGSKPVKI